MTFDAKRYWEARLTQSFGLHGTGYLGLGKGYNSWAYRVRSIIFGRIIKSLPNPESSRVLDIGSGTGFYLSQLAKLGIADVTGSDLTGISVNRLKAAYPSIPIFELDISSAENLSELKLGQFDVVTCIDVLFHVVDDEKYQNSIRSISALVKKGGHFLFSDSFIHAPTRKGTHHVNRNISEITTTLESCGFTISSRLPMFQLMNEPVDSNNRYLWAFWRWLTRLVKLNNVIGYSLGLLLFPVELMLLSVLTEGPSTEMMVCRKS